jgi:hypothetical protein
LLQWEAVTEEEGGNGGKEKVKINIQRGYKRKSISGRDRGRRLRVYREEDNRE